MTLRIGLIGCGAAGQAHAAAYRGIEGVELRAVADTDVAAATRLAAIAGCQALSPGELLAADLDVVAIATPTPTHAALVQEAARRGKDILCETPLARTLDQARAAVAACREAEVRLIPLHLNAFMPPLRRAGELLADGSLGQVGVVRITRRLAPRPAGERRRHPRPPRPGYSLPDWLLRPGRAGLRRFHRQPGAPGRGVRPGLPPPAERHYRPPGRELAAGGSGRRRAGDRGQQRPDRLFRRKHGAPQVNPRRRAGETYPG